MQQKAVFSSQIYSVQLSIVIVNYNVKHFLEQCLCSVIKACANLDAAIFVIDNNSDDGSNAYFENRFDTVQFIWNKSNTGFAKANNQALPMLKGKHVLFLNPDTIVAEDSLIKCIHYLESHSLCGAIGVHMIDGAGNFLKESKRSFPSPLASVFKLSGLAALFPRSLFFAKYYAPQLSPEQTGKVDVLSGAFMMLKKEVVEITKGFDEDFFMYGEDIDLSYRIRQAGFEIHYFPGTSIVHFKGESSQQNKESYITNFYGAMKLFAHKHYRHQKLLSSTMRLSINAAAAVAGLKKSLVGLKKKQLSNIQNKNTAIVAGQEEFNDALQIIKDAAQPLIILGRIATGENDYNPYIGNLMDFKKIIFLQNISTIIFCAKDLEYKTMISLMKDNPGLAYFFHGASAKSIAGGGDNVQPGFSIAEP